MFICSVEFVNLCLGARTIVMQVQEVVIAISDSTTRVSPKTELVTMRSTASVGMELKEPGRTASTKTSFKLQRAVLYICKGLTKDGSNALYFVGRCQLRLTAVQKVFTVDSFFLLAPILILTLRVMER